MSAPVSLDTYNFSADLKGQKWLPVDEEAMNMLREHDSSLHQSHYWRQLYDVKSNIQKNLDLGCKKILQKDFKKF